MRQVEAKTFVSEEILLHEYDYMYGDKKDQKVNFTYINKRTGKENTKYGAFDYHHALCLARERHNDGRYKNFEYIIG